MFTTIIIFIIVLSVLVFAHELGHFWVAKRFGLKPKEFGFGMPPRIFGFYKNVEGKWQKVRGNKMPDDAADTIYSINWLPLGGFVALGEDEGPSADPNHFQNKAAWKRFLILSAGVTMNIILAAFLLSAGYMIGLPQAIDADDSRASVSERKIQISQVLPDSPAAQAGLAAGDVILSIDEQEFIASEELQKYVDGHTGQKIAYRIRRGQDDMQFELVPELRADTARGGIGIAITETGIVKYSFFYAIWNGLKLTFFMTWFIIVAFFDLIKGLVMGHGISVELGGPVRIAQITGDAARMGFAYLINFSAILSINLAIINALPFPALDGGRIMFIALEKIMRRPLKRELEGTIHYIGFVLLMIMVALVTYKDIARLF